MSSKFNVDPISRYPSEHSTVVFIVLVTSN